MSKIRKYTKEEEELILNNSLKKANALSHLELANMLGRTVEGIRKKEKELKRRRTYDKRVVSDRWTDEDIKYMKDMIDSGKVSIVDITKALKKDFKVVEAKMLELSIANRKKGKAWRLWTEEEENYLRRWHGIERPMMIGIYLGRSLESIHQKAKKMKLGNKKVYYSANECSKLLGIEPSTFIRHINSGYIRVRKAVTEQLIYQIRIEDLYEFMENHQDKWDSRNLAYEPFLTEKPNWYIEKCKKDKENPLGYLNKCKKWTEEEVSILFKLVEEGKSVSEISNVLNRSYNSVQNRIKREEYNRIKEELRLKRKIEIDNFVRLRDEMENERAYIKRKAYKVTKRNLTEDDIELLSNIRMLGFEKDDDIYNVLGVDAKYVYTVIDRYEDEYIIKVNRRALTDEEKSDLYDKINQGYSMFELASEFSKSYSDILRIYEDMIKEKPDNRNRWTDEEVKLLLKLKSEGLSLFKISRMIPNKTYSAVRSKVYTLSKK